LRSKLYEFRLTPKETAERSGVGVRFVREMLAGKPTLRMDKVNDVLRLFDATLGYENIPAARDEQDSSFDDDVIPERDSKDDIFTEDGDNSPE